MQRVTASAVGITPVRFVIEVRLDEAGHLLRTSALTADAVAARVGFRNGGAAGSRCGSCPGAACGPVDAAPTTCEHHFVQSAERRYARWRELAPDEERQESVRRFKRELIRHAAAQVFAAHGIEGASMREIARTAGYTTGAIYTYFASKEDLYAEVLRDSLESLLTEVRDAADAASEHRAAAALRGLWTFYDTRRADFELGFYLYGGARPVGLTRELDRELNARLDRVIDVIGHGLVADGIVVPARAHRAAVAEAVWVFGLLLMAKTGRLRSLGEDAATQLDDHLHTLTTKDTG